MPEVVGYVVGRRIAIRPAIAAVVAGHRDLAIDEFLPHRVVVVGAVHAEAVNIHAALFRIGLPVGVGFEGAGNDAVHGQHLDAQRVRVLYLRDGLVRPVQRDHARWNGAIRNRTEHIRNHHVVGTHGRLKQFVVGNFPGQGKSQRGIHQRDVDPPVVQLFAKHARDHGGSAVLRFHRQAPPARAADALALALFRGKRVPGVSAAVDLFVTFHHARPRHLVDIAPKHRIHFQPVAVCIHHRMLHSVADAIVSGCPTLRPSWLASVMSGDRRQRAPKFPCRK